MNEEAALPPKGRPSLISLSIRVGIYVGSILDRCNCRLKITGDRRLALCLSPKICQGHEDRGFGDEHFSRHGRIGSVLFGLILVDHWIWPLPTWARFVAWGIIWGMGAWWLMTRIVPTWLRKVQQAYVAKQIERTMPELKNSLINWLQLSNEGDGTPRGVLAAVGRHAMGQLKDHDATAVIDQAGPIRWAALLAGCLSFVGSTWL